MGSIDGHRGGGSTGPQRPPLSGDASGSSAVRGLSEEDTAVLDDPVGRSLRGHHAHLARRRGRALTCARGVATFAAVPLHPRAQDWTDLAGLLGSEGFADLFSSPAVPPVDWEPLFTVDGVQMVATGGEPVGGVAGDGVRRLAEPDVPAALELTARTRPGPFWPRTHLMGDYLGVWEDGVLVAMAGERLHQPGWSEISAVCTAPEARGRGLATRLVGAAAARITARGERPFLHVAAGNATAIALYERLGFRVRTEVTFRGFRTPPPLPAARLC